MTTVSPGADFCHKKSGRDTSALLFARIVIYQAYTATSISILLSTDSTPGAVHAMFSASFFSAHDRTLPRSVTLLPEISILIEPESTVALLWYAAEILRWIAPPKKLPQVKPNNRIRLLQEKIDLLIPFEKENAQLHRKLQANEEKQKRLEEI